MKTIYFNWQYDDWWSATFIRWQRCRLPRRPWDKKYKGGWWGIGAVIQWELFKGLAEWRASSRRAGLKPGQLWLAPHSKIYLVRPYWKTVFGKRRLVPGIELPRPTLEQYQRLARRRARR